MASHHYQSLELLIERDLKLLLDVPSIDESSKFIPGASIEDIGRSFHHNNSFKHVQIHSMLIGKRAASQTKCTPDTPFEMRRKIEHDALNKG